MDAKVQFVFELELYVEGRENWEELPLDDDSNWVSRSEGVLHSLRDGFPDPDHEPSVKASATNDFSTWCLTESHRNAAWFRIVSPKFDFDARDKWIWELIKVYEIIEMNRCKPSGYWSGKIHVTTPGFSVDQAKGLARTIMQHYRSFLRIHQVLWCTTVNPTTEDLNPIAELRRIGASYINRVEMAETFDDVARWMNADRDNKPDPNRIWNFWPLVGEWDHASPFYKGHRKTGFVEYTFEPEDYNFSCARTWINFICLFVEGALRYQGNWSGAYNYIWPRNVMFEKRFLLKFVLDQARDPDVAREQPVTEEEQYEINALFDTALFGSGAESDGS